MSHEPISDTQTFAYDKPCDYCQQTAHILLPDDYGDRRSCGLPAHVQRMYDGHAFDAMMTAAVRDGRSHAVRGSDGRWTGTTKPDLTTLDRMSVTRWVEQPKSDPWITP